MDFANDPSWTSSNPSALDQGDYNCLGVESFRLAETGTPAVTAPRLLFSGPGGGTFVPRANFGLWMGRINPTLSYNADIVSRIFEYSVINTMAGDTVTVQLSKFRNAASVTTLRNAWQSDLPLADRTTPDMCADLNYEYRIGPVYSEEPSYVPFWNICSCPSSCETNIGESALCSFPTPSDGTIQRVAMYAIPRTYCASTSTVLDKPELGTVVARVPPPVDRVYVPQAVGLRTQDFDNAAENGNSLDFYTPGRYNDQMHVEFPSTYRPRDKCQVFLAASAVPTVTSNAWLSSAWAKIGAIGANQVGTGFDPRIERAMTVDFADVKYNFNNRPGADAIEHCNPADAITLHQDQSITQNSARTTARGWSYRWARWGHDLSICENQPEVDTTLRSYASADIQGTWSVLKVPNGACVNGLGYPALRESDPLMARRANHGMAWVPFNQRVSAADVRSIGEEHFMPLQTSITKCSVTPTTTFTSNDANFFQMDEVAYSQFSFLTDEMRDATVSDLLSLKLNDLVDGPVEISCPIVSPLAGCGDINQASVFRLARVDDVNFELCDCTAFTCTDGVVTCTVDKSGVYGILRTPTDGCEVREDTLIGDGDAGNRTQWAVGFGLGIGLAFLLALCAWWIFAYHFGNCCAWCCGFIDGSNRKKELIQLPVNRVTIPVERTVMMTPPPTVMEPPPVTQIVYEAQPSMVYQISGPPGPLDPQKAQVVGPPVTVPVGSMPLDPQYMGRGGPRPMGGPPPGQPMFL